MRLVLLFGCLSLVSAIEWKQGDRAIWAENCDFGESGNMGREQSSGELCGAKCRASSPCTHFTYLDGWCYKKSGSVSKNDAFPKNRVMCGILDNKPSGIIQKKIKLYLQNLNIYFFIEKKQVEATRHGANEIGSCELPSGSYVTSYAVALGNLFLSKFNIIIVTNLTNFGIKR